MTGHKKCNSATALFMLNNGRVEFILNKLWKWSDYIWTSFNKMEAYMGYVYGDVAVAAAALLVDGVEPRDAWNKKTVHLSKSSRDKGCPRSAFIGLCNVGYVKGSKQVVFDFEGLGKNACYAVEAVKLLRRNPGFTAKELWAIVTKENENATVHNSQMHVVLALNSEGLIDFDSVKL
ncbi:hypothetical protein V1481_02680 [Aeromonas enteropelogenes]|uniref:DUF6979 family protein n=1 Tax=Aeromonas enteropelogenes TaxID=29489 RepID=UPI00313549A3